MARYPELEEARRTLAKYKHKRKVKQEPKEEKIISSRRKTDQQLFDNLTVTLQEIGKRLQERQDNIDLLEQQVKLLKLQPKTRVKYRDRPVAVPVPTAPTKRPPKPRRKKPDRLARVKKRLMR